MSERTLIPRVNSTTDIGKIKVKEIIPDGLTLEQTIEIIRSNADEWRELKTYYTCAMMEVETKFKVLDAEFSLQYDRNPIETIKTRIKSPESLAAKVMRRHIAPDIATVESNIFDMAGVRVICSFPEDVYMLAESFLAQDDVFLLEKKDYIQSPKPNGYRALHLIVEVPIFLHRTKRMMKVEVQLRTIAMDFWASLEHKLRYKKDIPDDLADEIGKELLACAEMSARLDMDMQAIREKIENY